jgi:hypothetical protein
MSLQEHPSGVHQAEVQALPVRTLTLTSTIECSNRSQRQESDEYIDEKKEHGNYSNAEVDEAGEVVLHDENGRDKVLGKCLIAWHCATPD